MCLSQPEVQLKDINPVCVEQETEKKKSPTDHVSVLGTERELVSVKNPSLDHFQHRTRTSQTAEVQKPPADGSEDKCLSSMFGPDDSCIKWTKTLVDWDNSGPGSSSSWWFLPFEDR